MRFITFKEINQKKPLKILITGMGDFTFQSFIIDNTANAAAEHLNDIKKYLYYKILNHEYNLHKTRKKVSQFKYCCVTNCFSGSQGDAHEDGDMMNIPGIKPVLEFYKVDNLKSAELALEVAYDHLNHYDDLFRADSGKIGSEEPDEPGVLIPGILLNKLKLKTHQENMEFQRMEIVVFLKNFQVFEMENEEEIEALFEEFYTESGDEEIGEMSQCRLKFVLLEGPVTGEDFNAFETSKLQLFVTNLKQNGSITTLNKELEYYEYLDFHIPKPVKVFDGTLWIGDIDRKDGCINIPVEGYPSIKKLTNPITKKTVYEDPSTGELKKLKHNIQYKYKRPSERDEDDDDEEEDENEEDEDEEAKWIDTNKDTVVKGYRYQSNYVILPEFLIKQTTQIRSQETENYFKPSIQVRGCLPRKSFPRECLMGETIFVVCNLSGFHSGGKTQFGDFLGFNCLVDALLDDDNVLIARHISKKREISMCVLIPYVLETKDRTLLLCKLPFSEDEKKGDFQNLFELSEMKLELENNGIKDEQHEEPKGSTQDTNYQQIMDDYVTLNTFDKGETEINLNKNVYMKQSLNPSSIEHTLHRIKYPSMNVKNMLTNKLLNDLYIKDIDSNASSPTTIADRRFHPDPNYINNFDITQDIYKGVRKNIDLLNVESVKSFNDKFSKFLAIRKRESRKSTSNNNNNNNNKRARSEEEETSLIFKDENEEEFTKARKVEIKSLEDILSGF